MEVYEDSPNDILNRTVEVAKLSSLWLRCNQIVWKEAILGRDSDISSLLLILIFHSDGEMKSLF